MLTLLPLIGFVFLFIFFILAPSRVKFGIYDWRDAFATVEKDPQLSDPDHGPVKSALQMRYQRKIELADVG